MFFYLYRKNLKQLRDENATKEEIKDDLYIFKHSYIMSFISSVLCSTVLAIFFSLYLCGIGLTLCIIYLITKVYIFTIFAMIMATFAVLTEVILLKRNKWINKGKKSEDFYKILLDKFHNIYLLNPFVISYKDWKKLKKVSRKNYDKIRSFQTMKKCYETIFYIANLLKNKNIKIMWILCNHRNEKFGHAVLVKGNYILDTNRRKTYNKKKYLEHFHAKVYKEITLDEYLVKNPKGINLLLEEGINARGVYVVLKKYWDEFKDFCEENGGIRCNNDLT